MASKKNNMNRDIIMFALLGLAVGILARLYFSLQFDETDMWSQVERRIQDAVITLVVKFQHFFISRWLQMRYMIALGSASSSTMSILFWVAFTRSISSMSDNPLE